MYFNIYLGSNISSEWSVLPSATGALAAIAKCQHYKKGIASYSASITQHVKTANLWLKQNSLMEWQGVKKLQRGKIAPKLWNA